MIRSPRCYPFFILAFVSYSVFSFPALGQKAPSRVKALSVSAEGRASKAFEEARSSEAGFATPQTGQRFTLRLGRLPVLDPTQRKGVLLFYYMVPGSDGGRNPAS